MLVVSDTTPIISLMKAHRLSLLQELFGEVVIPKAVCEELVTNERYPQEAGEIISCPFIRVACIKNQEAVRILRNVTGLDAGESEAIVLYGELQADVLVIDEHKGRSVAKQMEVKRIGTIGILMEAFDEGRLAQTEVIQCLELMKDAGIRISKALYDAVIAYMEKSGSVPE